MQELKDILKTINLNIGRDWKYSRLRKDLSVGQLSELSGVSKSTIYQLEKYGRRISKKTLVKLCDAMGLYYTKMEPRHIPKAIELGQFIKESRELKEISIRELSKRSGVFVSTINNVEKKHKIISDESIEKLAKGLEIGELELLIKKYKAILPEELHYIFNEEECKKRKNWFSDIIGDVIKFSEPKQFRKVFEMLINKGRIKIIRRHSPEYYQAQLRKIFEE